VLVVLVLIQLIQSPEHEKKVAMDFVLDVMGKPPKWATGLPIACEGDYADNYGDC
jgi:hypothetical protein